MERPGGLDTTAPGPKRVGPKDEERGCEASHSIRSLVSPWPAPSTVFLRSRFLMFFHPDKSHSPFLITSPSMHHCSLGALFVSVPWIDDYPNRADA